MANRNRKKTAECYTVNAGCLHEVNTAVAVTIILRSSTLRTCQSSRKPPIFSNLHRFLFWHFRRIYLTRLASSIRSCPPKAEAGTSEYRDWRSQARPIQQKLRNLLSRVGSGVLGPPGEDK